MNLNNLFPLVGAVFPSFYAAFQSPGIPNTYLNRFMYSALYSLFAVTVSFITIHREHIKKPVPWMLHHGAEMELSVYIITIGLAGLLLIELLYRVVAGHVPTPWLARTLSVVLLGFALILVGHIALIDNQF